MMKKNNLQNERDIIVKKQDNVNDEKKQTKVNYIRRISAVLAIALIIVTIIYLSPLIKDLFTEAGRIRFKETVKEWGIGGVFVLFALQIAQIFLFIIPGEPIEILAGMCFGSIWGTIFILCSSLIISTVIFFLVKKYGKKFVYSFCDKRKIFKLKRKLLKNPQKIETILLTLFLIPGTPKDLLVYIAGLLPVNPIRFLIIATIARMPSVISSTIAGANIVIGNIKISILIYVFVYAFVGVLLFLINKFDKVNNEVKND